MENIGYYNGKSGLIEEMSVPMNDRAIYFADGVYEVACAKNGIVYLMNEHIDRFFRSCGRIDIQPPFTKEWLGDTLSGLIRQVDADVCRVYWQVSRGTALRSFPYPEGARPNLYITATPLELPDLKAKLRLITLEDKRSLFCDIKSIALLPNVMAAQRAKEAGCDEAVLHRVQRVTECSHSNILILKNGTLRTAPCDNYILPGIARRHIIGACRKLRIPVDEKPFTVEELFAADEVLLSSSTKFCLSAAEVDGRRVGGKAEGLLSSIQEEVMDEFHCAVGA